MTTIDHTQFLRAVHDVAIAMLRQDTLDDLVWCLASEVARVLRVDDCIIYLRKSERLVQVAAYGPKNPSQRTIVNPLTIPVGEGITGLVAKTGSSLIVRNTRDDAFYIKDTEEGCSELAVPILWQGQVLGVIDSEDPRDDYYTVSMRILVERIADVVAPRLASALEEDRRRRQLEELRSRPVVASSFP